MIEKPIEIRTPDGAADGFLIQPGKQGHWPGVLYRTDIFGIRDASRGMASRLAAGFCFSGQMALRAVAARCGQIAAAASFHCGGLYTDAPASPHLLPPRVRAHPYFGHGVEDRSMPQEAIEKLDRALAAWSGNYESEVYEAHHGWTIPDNPAYNEPQAERAYKKLTDLLNSTLKRN